jgi:hypothetical protein
MISKAYQKSVEEDVWNIRNRKLKNEPFVFSGLKADIILFCQPKLLYRGLKFNSESRETPHNGKRNLQAPDGAVQPRS